MNDDPSHICRRHARFNDRNCDQMSRGVNLDRDLTRPTNPGSWTVPVCVSWLVGWLVRCVLLVCRSMSYDDDVWRN